MRNEDIEIFYRINLYQLFHNSTKFFCKTDRQGNIRNIGKVEQNITFVYFDKVKYK